jgi:hypothetical protein
MSLDLYKKEFKFGLIPYGPAIGQRAIQIDIGSNIDTKYVKGDTYRIFKEKIKEADLEKQFIEAINGSSSIFLLFKGGGVELNENAIELQEFFLALGKESLEVQKTLKLAVNKVKPPFCVWYGLPQEFSTKRENTGDIFQYFNSCYLIFNSSEDKYNPLGLQQVLNHQFSMICMNYVENKTEKLYKELKEKFNLTRKVAFIDENEQQSEKCKQFCLSKDIRYYRYEKGDNLLIF